MFVYLKGMFNSKLFKSRTNYVFDYKPRFYDERKERIEKLEEKYHKNSNVVIEKPSLSRTNLKNEWKRHKHLAHDKKANRRLIIIITILVGIVAYVFDLHTIIK